MKHIAVILFDIGFFSIVCLGERFDLGEIDRISFNPIATGKF